MASPSAMAVLPTPGSPISTGLFFFRRLSTCATRSISFSRPTIGIEFVLGRQLGQVMPEIVQDRRLRFLRLLLGVGGLRWGGRRASR